MTKPKHKYVNDAIVAEQQLAAATTAPKKRGGRASRLRAAGAGAGSHTAGASAAEPEPGMRPRLGSTYSGFEDAAGTEA